MLAIWGKIFNALMLDAEGKKTVKEGAGGGAEVTRYPYVTILLSGPAKESCLLDTAA